MVWNHKLFPTAKFVLFLCKMKQTSVENIEILTFLSFIFTGECQLNLGEILSDPTMSKMLMGGGAGGLGGMGGLGGGLGGLGGGLGGKSAVPVVCINSLLIIN